jgi:hypothetical protein
MATNDPTPERINAKYDADDKPTRASDGELDEPWVETDHDRVYYANESDQSLWYDPASVGKQLAEAFPNWDIVITCGPYRTYDIGYDIRFDLGAIHIDCYSARPPSQEALEGTVRDIHKGIERLASGETTLSSNEGDA